MFRATLTFVAAVTLTVLLGIPALTIGLLLPQRACFDHLFYWWSFGIVMSAGARVLVTNDSGHDLAEPCFLVGNHQSALDIPAMAVVTRGRARFLAKRSLFQLPVIGWCMSIYGCVPVDRGSPRKTQGTLQVMLDRLRARRQLMLVFAEGTRSTTEAIRPFKQGSMNICRKAGMPIVPFAIEGSLKVHQRGVFRVRPGTIQVALGPAIQVSELSNHNTTDIARRVQATVVGLYENLQADRRRTAATAAPREAGS